MHGFSFSSEVSAATSNIAFLDVLLMKVHDWTLFDVLEVDSLENMLDNDIIAL